MAARPPTHYMMCSRILQPVGCRGALCSEVYVLPPEPQLPVYGVCCGTYTNCGAMGLDPCYWDHYKNCRLMFYIQKFTLQTLPVTIHGPAMNQAVVVLNFEFCSHHVTPTGSKCWCLWEERTQTCTFHGLYSSSIMQKHLMIDEGVSGNSAQCCLNKEQVRVRSSFFKMF